MCETKLKLQIVLIVLFIMFDCLYAVDDSTGSTTDAKIDRETGTGTTINDNSESGTDTTGGVTNDTAILFTVTRAPRYFGILQDHRGQPLSVEVSEEYMDQDYIATNRKRHKIDWNKNPLDMEDFEEDETEETFDEKDKDVKVPNKFNLQAGPV